MCTLGRLRVDPQRRRIFGHGDLNTIYIIAQNNRFVKRKMFYVIEQGKGHMKDKQMLEAAIIIAIEIAVAIAAGIIMYHAYN